MKKKGEDYEVIELTFNQSQTLTTAIKGMKVFITKTLPKASIQTPDFKEEYFCFKDDFNTISKILKKCRRFTKESYSYEQIIFDHDQNHDLNNALSNMDHFCFLVLSDIPTHDSAFKESLKIFISHLQTSRKILRK
jgi:hypothetical protein